MVVYVDGIRADDSEKERAILEWIARNPVAAARLILMLMPEGNWTETDKDSDWN